MQLCDLKKCLVVVFFFTNFIFLKSSGCKFFVCIYNSGTVSSRFPPGGPLTVSLLFEMSALFIGELTVFHV